MYDVLINEFTTTTTTTTTKCVHSVQLVHRSTEDHIFHVLMSTFRAR